MSGRIEMHALHVLRRLETRDFAGSVKPPNHSSSVCWLHVYRKLNLLFSSENSTHEQTKRENTASGTLWCTWSWSMSQNGTAEGLSHDQISFRRGSVSESVLLDMVSKKKKKVCFGLHTSLAERCSLSVCVCALNLAQGSYYVCSPNTQAAGWGQQQTCCTTCTLEVQQN